ncbi:unnamed protein product [Phytophthora lilii]|uniref:Unnamed protein product n=1 Tax=Phytophthora lilii TaxID=2077276 RepID=A0A9W6UEL7_9STRA|nr:unnamed protein product [Phytophthora lilii]
MLKCSPVKHDPASLFIAIPTTGQQMESSSTADFLDASLELLDDVEGFDLLLCDEGDADEEVEILKSTRKLRHQRKKNELEYLRKEVMELEKELERLKASSRTQVESDCDKGDIHAASLWERVAKNQRRERMKAEVENVKLRERLEGQLKIAKSLEKLLRKRPADDTTSKDEKIRKLAGLREDEVFGVLSERVNDLHKRADLVMDEAGFTIHKNERNGARVKLNETAQVCVEMVDAKILPFGVHDVAKATWKTLSTKRIELDNGYYSVPEFCVVLRLRRAEALTRMHIVGKRVVEENRVVMVWSTIGQMDGTPFHMHSITLSEYGWTVVENIGENLSSGGVTIVQSCVRMTPELDDVSEKKESVGVLTDLVLGSYGLNMQTLHQGVENNLVHDALGF